MDLLTACLMDLLTKPLSKALQGSPPWKAKMKLISFEDIRRLGIDPADCLNWAEEGLLNKDGAQLPPKMSLQPTGTPDNTVTATLLCVAAAFPEREFKVGLLRNKEQHVEIVKRFEDYTRLHFHYVDSAYELANEGQVLVSCVTVASRDFCSSDDFAPGSLLVPKDVFDLMAACPCVLLLELWAGVLECVTYESAVIRTSFGCVGD